MVVSCKIKHVEFYQSVFPAQAGSQFFISTFSTLLARYQHVISTFTVILIIQN